MSGSARLEYDVHGLDGSVVVLLHGLGGSRHAWCHIPCALARAHRVIVPDLRGCGGSERGTETYTFDLLARDVLSVLDAAGARLCHLVGHSLGGVIAQHVLVSHPQRFASAVLVSTSSRVGEQAAQAWRRIADAVEQKGLVRAEAGSDRSFAEGYGDRHPDVVQRLAAITAASDPHVYAEQARIAADYDYSAALRGVPRPVLVLQGLADRMTSPGGSVILSRAFPHATLEMIEGVGHNLHLELNDEFVERIGSFFAAVDGA